MTIPPWRHGVALLLVLVGTGLLLRPDTPATSDEGAARAQAETVRLTDGWAWAWPGEELAPSDSAMPISGAERADEGWLTYPKHPAYIAVLSGALTFETAGSVVLNGLALTGAALLAGDLAHRWWGRNRRSTIWVVGLGTPLTFSVSISWAHTVAAFCATAGVWGIEVWKMRSDGSHLRWLSPAIGIGGLFAAGMFRNEGVLFGLAIAGGLLFTTVRSHSARPPGESRRLLLIAVASASASAASYIVDAAWSSQIRGGPLDGFDTLSQETGLRQKLLGASHVLIGTGDRTDIGALLGVAGLALAVGVGVAIARRRTATGPLLVMLAVVCSMGAIVARADLITGIATAWPLGVMLVITVIVVSREATSPVAANWALVAAALFLLGVLATQWTDGGGLEWGGRYLQLAVPILVAAGLPPMLTALMTLRRTAVFGRLLPAALVVAIAAPTVQSWGALYDLRSRNLDGITFVDESRASLGTSNTTEPMIVTDIGVLGRMTWRTALESRMLLARTITERRAVIESLFDSGIDEFVTITGPDRRSTWRMAAGTSYVVADERLDRRSGLVAIRFSRIDAAAT